MVLSSALILTDFMLKFALDRPFWDINGIVVGEAACTVSAAIAAVRMGDHLHAVDAEIAQAVHTNLLADFLHRQPTGDQLVLAVDVGAKVAWSDKGRRGDAHMDFGGARLPQHSDNAGTGGAADDGIIHQDDPLPFDGVRQRSELDAHRILALVLGRLDKGAPHIAVFDEANSIGNT